MKRKLIRVFDFFFPENIYKINDYALFFWILLLLSLPFIFEWDRFADSFFTKHDPPNYLVAPVLASTVFDPSYTIVNTSGTTLTAVDAANLQVTFTAPGSGHVIVSLSALAGPVAPPLKTATPTTTNLYWGLLNASGGAIVQYENVGTFIAGVASNYPRVNVPLNVSGLTAGKRYTFLWAHSVNRGGSQCLIAYGGSHNPAMMTVEAVR